MLPEVSGAKDSVMAYTLVRYFASAFFSLFFLGGGGRDNKALQKRGNRTSDFMSPLCGRF